MLLQRLRPPGVQTASGDPTGRVQCRVPRPTAPRRTLQSLHPMSRTDDAHASAARLRDEPAPEEWRRRDGMAQRDPLRALAALHEQRRARRDGVPMTERGGHRGPRACSGWRHR